MHVYFDMDGVLADFDGGIRTLCGLEPKPQGSGGPGWDDEMFAAIRAVGHFYRKLPPLEPALALLLEVLEALGPDNTAILTGVPKPKRGVPEAAEDKKAWIEEHLARAWTAKHGASGGAAPALAVHTVLRREKMRFAASREHILVDDFAANIREWEEAGGRGILHADAEDTRKRLVELGALPKP